MEKRRGRKIKRRKGEEGRGRRGLEDEEGEEVG